MQRAPDDQQQKNHGQGGQHHQVALAGTSYIGQLPNFTQDLERGTNAEHASTTSASLPALHPNPSEIFLQSQPPNRTGSPPRTTQPDEFEWGPSHPCFPHLNPHVPITSSAFASTRIIRIRRDWLISGDLAPTFSNLYPEILASYISENLFREIIGELNRRLIKIFCPWSYYNWLDATMGVFTLWIWEDLGLGLAKRKLAALEAWINEFNTMWGETDGVSIIPPRKTAFMTLDIQIPDPHLRIGRSVPTSGAGSHVQPDSPEAVQQSRTTQDNHPAIPTQRDDPLALPIMTG